VAVWNILPRWERPYAFYSAQMLHAMAEIEPERRTP
jgi:hypothetical protein